MKHTVLLPLAAAGGCWLLWGNRALEVTVLPVDCPGLPEAFQGLRIAQISDLHNASLGQGNARRLSALEQAAPDLIFLTGDLVDARRPHLPRALAFARQAAALAPTYYVPGNHEARLDRYPRLREGLSQAGVTVLEDRVVSLVRGGETLSLAGLADPGFARRQGDPRPHAAILRQHLAALDLPRRPFPLLLVHRPELFPLYAAQGAALVFSGHAHGGQVRLPGVGGLFAPSQGIFPRYQSGCYALGPSRMVVSRGLGNSLMPLRIGNRPELVVAVLTRGKPVSTAGGSSPC